MADCTGDPAKRQTPSPHPVRLRRQEFLSGTGMSDIGEDESDQSSTPKLSFDDSNEWVKWDACWVETLVWWPELQGVPSQRDTTEFAK